MLMKGFLSFILCLFIISKANAQLPILETLENNIYSNSKDVEIQSLNMDVKIFGNIAVTKLQMSFVNHSGRVMEGRLTFPLPDGANVTGYALDINGVLRNAVPVEKEKATAVFESVERRKIDPGILEKVEGNNFRTRIYPLPANEGVRTIEIVFQEELNVQAGKLEYYVPLPNKLYKTFSLHTTVFNNTQKPQLLEKPHGSFDFIKRNNSWMASIDKTNYEPTGSIRINIPVENFNANTILQKGSHQEYYFQATVKVPPHNIFKASSPGKLGIIWDNSLSRLNADVKKEKEFLRQYFLVNKNVSVEFAEINIAFKKTTRIKIVNGDTKKLFDLIDNVRYDGGTDFSQLRPMDVDEYLFFSDGLTTFGDLKLGIQDPVHTIVSNPVADFSQLKYIADQTGGRFINLNETKIPAALKTLTNKAYRFLGIASNSNIYELYPSQTECPGTFITLVGKTKDPNTNLELNFGYDKKQLQKVAVKLNAALISNDWNVEHCWAQKKLSELEVFYNRNKKEISDLGKQYGIVTKNTSLIILESLDDYIKYKIPPPAELREAYDEAVRQKEDSKREEINNLLDDAKNMMADLKNWHSTDFIALKEQKRIADSIATAARIRMEDSIRLATAARLIIEKRTTDSVKRVDSIKLAQNQQTLQRQLDSLHINVRGRGSISAGTTPLIVVDGAPFDGDISAISPNDIEDMNILNDASATSLYGARGSNGVIIIRTKRNMQESKNTLSEVVITTPYGPPVSKERYVGAADVVTGKRIENTPVSDISKSIEGAAPGVQATNGYYMSGSGATYQFSSNATSYQSYNSSSDNIVSSGETDFEGNSKVFEINSNAVYIKKLRKINDPKKAYELYLIMRQEYISTPTFYFDIANWFFKKEDVATGLRVLSNLAELDLENAEIYKTIAYTLKKYNQHEKLCYITNKVLDWRPNDPQSYRDYALALEDNGQYQKSLEVLYSALLQDYTDETLNRDKGIEETILMELNQLISKYHSKLNLKNIDTALIADLPVDIRVVMNWNLDNVDMDLHVIDPNKEECYYSHRTTEAGGRISDDFTDGFGPEQFILKKAIKGKYQIKTDYFSEGRVSGSGRTTLMAEVYLYYGTAKEQRKMVVFQSSQNDDDDEGNNNDDVLIGEFEF